jgi:hypothetical protein
VSILDGIASALGGVIQGTVIPGFGNVLVDVKRLSGTTRNAANESVGSWADVATGVRMRIDVLTADDKISTWGATSAAQATALASGLDVDVQVNDVVLVRQVLQGRFPTSRWKVEQNPYVDAAKMWQLALVPFKGTDPA